MRTYERFLRFHWTDPVKEPLGAKFFIAHKYPCW